MMKGKTELIKPGIGSILSDLDGYDSIEDLALDLRSSWNHEADEIWRQLEPALWDLTHNPWVVLHTVSRDKFRKIMSDPDFRKKKDVLKQSKESALIGSARPASDFTPRILPNFHGVSVPLEANLILWQH